MVLHLAVPHALLQDRLEGVRLTETYLEWRGKVMVMVASLVMSSRRGMYNLSWYNYTLESAMNSMLPRNSQ